MSKAIVLRARLMSPPNAVPDHGITMHNGWPVERPRPVAPEPVVIAFRPKPKRALWPGELAGDFWLAEMPEPEERGWRITVPCIRKAVCEVWRVTENDILSSRRHQPVCFARQVAMAMACHLTRHGLVGIGNRFGGRDHTTVLHAKRKLAGLIAEAGFGLSASATALQWARAMRTVAAERTS